MQHDDTLIAGNIQSLRQGIDLIRTIDDATYSTASAFSQSGLGSHFRHCIDFYNSFIAGIGSGRIDYDARERDLTVESERGRATEKMEAIIRSLGKLSTAEGEREVWVNSEGAENGDPRWSRSSIRRELQFLLSHTVHHYAIIAVHLRLRGIDPGQSFGVAPSTLRHWRQSA